MAWVINGKRNKMKEQKLLKKTQRYYTGFGLLMALCIVPLFYLLMQKYYLHEIDEYLYLQRKKIVKENFNELKISDIPAWNRFNSEETVLPDDGRTKKDIFITEPVFSEHEKGYIPYRFLYSPVQIEGEKFILTIRLNIYESRKILQSSALLQFLLFILLITGMTIVTRLIHRKLWNPFYKTISQTEQFNIRQQEMPPFVPTDTQEFNQLNRAVTTLIENNLQAYKIQKEFTENASHEMQTPLAVLRSKLDLLLQQPNLTKEQLQNIQTLYEASSRLVRMNKNLLLLAKMDNLQFPDTQELNANDLLKELLSFLSEQTVAANITLETQISDSPLFLQANKILLESLFINLLTNAIRHNVPGGKIIVKLEGNRLDIYNTGIAQPLDPSQLFLRFGRMNPSAPGSDHFPAPASPEASRVTTTQGSGLGLAIVRQICSLYGWQIDYGYELELHRFRVKFFLPFPP